MENENSAVASTSGTCASTSQDPVIVLDSPETGSDEDVHREGL